MLKRVKGMLKNQKGLTLVELLAVIVILGIIAAIAVPSIGNIIDNSKKDAHIANAQQLVSSARLAVAANDDLVKSLPIDLTPAQLQANGYLESSAFKDPDGGTYSDTTKVAIAKDAKGKVTYTVTLTNGTRGISSDDVSNLTRSDVK